ncbi:MAG: 2-dehydro-3-deoxygalactonokinase [Eubacteriales bacterium]|jgi:2-dehydro-3-deoxygalactonokinase
MQKYHLYYDSGTSNTRVYLLDENFSVVFTDKRNVGSKDSTLAGSNQVLIDCLKELYDEAVQQAGIGEEQIDAVYASGMITCPAGLLEVPHLLVPITLEQFSGSLVRYHEGTRLHRDVWLIPGLKTVSDDIDLVNNVRGEEIEILGAMDELAARYPGEKLAYILPGSHTHVMCAQDDSVTGIISNCTGELFYAIKSATIFGPILAAQTQGLDEDMLRKGRENLKKYGFNRALYISRAMSLFGESDELGRKSYAEGVITGGVATALDYYCQHQWQGCKRAVLISNEYMYRVFQVLLEDSPYIKEVLWLPISDKKSYGIEGLRKILACRARKAEQV